MHFVGSRTSPDSWLASYEHSQDSTVRDPLRDSTVRLPQPGFHSQNSTDRITKQTLFGVARCGHVLSGRLPVLLGRLSALPRRLSPLLGGLSLLPRRLSVLPAKLAVLEGRLSVLLGRLSVSLASRNAFGAAGKGLSALLAAELP